VGKDGTTSFTAASKRVFRHSCIWGGARGLFAQVASTFFLLIDCELTLKDIPLLATQLQRSEMHKRIRKLQFPSSSTLFPDKLTHSVLLDFMSQPWLWKFYRTTRRHISEDINLNFIINIIYSITFTLSSLEYMHRLYITLVDLSLNTRPLSEFNYINWCQQAGTHPAEVCDPLF
jgi:hypothetical protein